MHLRFFWIGETKRGPYSELEEAYLAKIGRFFVADRVIVPELKKSDPRAVAARLDKEGDALLRRLPTNGLLVVLDEKGIQFSSRQLARFLNQKMVAGISEMSFVVGGYLGIPPKVLHSADARISLSRMTLAHELARVVLLEQLYRAVSILKGLPYHR